jgi:hypothetical protein
MKCACRGRSEDCLQQEGASRWLWAWDKDLTPPSELGSLWPLLLLEGARATASSSRRGRCRCRHAQTGQWAVGRGQPGRRLSSIYTSSLCSPRPLERCSKSHSCHTIYTVSPELCTARNTAEPLQAPLATAPPSFSGSPRSCGPRHTRRPRRHPKPRLASPPSPA